VAISLLKVREGEVADGRLPAVKAQKTTFDELKELYLKDYQINGRKSIRRARELAARLTARFDGLRAREITSQRILNYILDRQAARIANGTINRELAALKRMFRLGTLQTPPLVVVVPYIPHLEENNVRRGFFTEEEYKLLRAALPDHVKVPLIIAYWTGMRAGEIVSLRWEQVDLEQSLVRLEPGTTKNNQARLVPLVEEVTKALWQWKQRMLLEYPNCPWVCHYRGRRLIRVPKRAWQTACRRVGLGGKLFHDLRRTAVRNMSRSGIPERVAMLMSGHKTRSIFDRYHIVSQSDLLVAKERLEAFGAMEASTENLAAAHRP
jgi:integrase